MRFLSKTVAVARAILCRRPQPGIAAFVLVLSCLSLTGFAQKTQKSAKPPAHGTRIPAAAAVPAPVEAPPPPPLPPPTPEQMPPGVPQVSWDGEQLSISSDNSTLADILTAVRRLTGADIDIPAGASGQRVAARLGPGPAREILASLLSGTDFNYVIQAADENPLGIQSVVLTPRNKGGVLAGSKSAVVAAMQHPDMTNPVQSSNPRNSDKSESPLEASSTADKVSAEAPSNPEARTAPATAPPTPADAKAASAEPQAASAEPLPVQADLTPPPTPAEPDANRPKTIEDKIQDMQSLFEQRRQMVEQSRKPQSTN